ncbi:benzoate 1,2-dioxygenase electron transfer component BenC [Knoellia koreensis]|uniref:1,6-dihydroxycyclohexa-2,4-diene-1-carboxylate dehydrogenase n=1 Tax=Knoellia koreensis TaxID=2730921 RepID=A0A849HM47_9MICO|nr:benzoate 1,2-dioxygenase electron transfer component BenC [Knoellia sp. DB2414S]NNM48169.1 1,6-dihydroxycyclohexa-2,4-diene-1-carboxylate dehydrogenase [Knoellia sp. DB2414S]
MTTYAAPPSGGHQVALSFEDGVTRFITCREDQTVADASYRARINIPLDCRDGACGTCKAFCESGDFDGGTYIDDALSESEAAEGYALPCSMKPRSDLVLQIASTSAVAKTQAATFTGTVTRLDRLSSTTVALAVEIAERDKLTFLPGQYVNIAVPGTDETRSYSFSSAPDDDELSFLIKLSPGGLMTEHLNSVTAVGDSITFTGPLGSFFLRETARPALLLAGGTGLAPILAILRKLRADGNERPIHLVYGVGTDEDLVELDTIEALAADLPGFTWDYCVSDPGSQAPNKGYVTTLIRDEHLHGGDVAVYLCGPPAMVESVRKHFSDKGMTPTGFYYEKFALAAAGAQEAADSQGDAAVDDVTEVPAAARNAGYAAASPRSVPLTVVPDPDLAREVTRQPVFVPRETAPLGAVTSDNAASVDAAADAALLRQVARQTVFASAAGESVRSGPAAPALVADDGLVLDATAREVTRQTVFPARDVEQLVAPAVAPTVAPSSAVTAVTAGQDAPAVPTAATTPPPAAERSGEHAAYEIGEEHPSVHESDAVFEARQALELGAIELTIGRLSTQQLAGYRLLAESTLPYVDVAGERFVDAGAYTEANAAFHDYLFAQTRNEHLLQAYQALGVKGHMDQVLRNATWCHPRCATDHVEIVEAFEAGDRTTARRLVVEHAERSKVTMRRAMADAQQRLRPAHVSPGRFDGLAVLVTGAAQGIGEAVARRISAEGGTVVLADRSELVESLAGELAAAGRESLAVTADLETWEGAQAVVDAALARFGRIDVAIHTVGGTIWAKPFTEYPPEQIEAEISRSLFPTLWGCRAVAPHMVGRGSGTIVNVSSVATRGLHRVPYAAAKGGVNAITASLAMELAPSGVRVVATAPGGTEAPARRIPRGPAPESEQEKAWYQTIVDQTVDSSLLKRYGTLDEQAAAICFVASPEASYITGTVLPVAGGDLG